MDDQKSLEAQLLGDMGYEDPRKAAQPQIQYQELSDEQIAILQQQRAAKGQPPYTDEEIAELKADFIQRQRTQAMEAAMAAQAEAQKAAAAALLAEPEDYSQPERKPQHEALPQVDASALLEEPAPEPERKVVFNQEDLQAAKMSAAKRASDSLKEIPAQTAEARPRGNGAAPFAAGGGACGQGLHGLDHYDRHRRPGRRMYDPVLDRCISRSDISSGRIQIL